MKAHPSKLAKYLGLFALLFVTLSPMSGLALLGGPPNYAGREMQEEQNDKDSINKTGTGNPSSTDSVNHSGTPDQETHADSGIKENTPSGHQ